MHSLKTFNKKFINNTKEGINFIFLIVSYFYDTDKKYKNQQDKKYKNQQHAYGLSLDIILLYINVKIRSCII